MLYSNDMGKTRRTGQHVYVCLGFDSRVRTFHFLNGQGKTVKKRQQFFIYLLRSTENCWKAVKGQIFKEDTNCPSKAWMKRFSKNTAYIRLKP